MRLGRATEENVQAHQLGMDLRLPQHRRETFLRFYEFHLRYASHPGCVYYLLPYLTRGFDEEQRLWFAYLNGNTQNPVTTWLIFREFSTIHGLDSFKLQDWFTKNYVRLAFDTDRRYFKKRFLECVENYRVLLAGRSQREFFGRLMTDDPRRNFRNHWALVGKLFVYFGRLSSFSYLEYLRISGLPLDCDQLFLHEQEGSKSHRNGLCKVLGRDDLDWHESNPAFDGRYTGEMLEWLAYEAEQLLEEARVRMKGKPYAGDVGYFTLESALCTYKSWHRPNRRYANVYNDMLVDRIRLAEKSWGALDVFWAARRHNLPEVLRLEDNPADCGVKPKKQNHYRQTGRPVMLGHEWPEMWSDFDEEVANAKRKG